MTTRDQHTPRAGRALLATATLFVGVIAVGAFGLSFNALQDLAVRSGITPSIAWLWPVIVDGFIITAMLVIFAWRGAPGRVTAWPWTAFTLFACISIAGNAIHTSVVVDGTSGIHVGVAMAVGAVPPVALLLASEMVVRITAGREAAIHEPRRHEPEPTPNPEPRLEVPDTVPAEWPELPTVERPAPTSADVQPEPVTAIAAPPDDAVLAPDTTGTASAPAVTSTAIDAPAETATGTTTVSSRANEPVGGDTPATGTDGPGTPRVTGDATDNADATGPGTGSEEAASVAGAPRPRPTGWTPEIIAGGGIPSDVDAQIAWIVDRAERGEDVAAATLAELLEVSLRTAHRRLASARDRAPSAFGPAAEETAEVAT